jgi:hypothetical protein
MILYRHCDPRFPFLWQSPNQPAGRWHGEGEGLVQYFADTPDGAWAELLRHEGITDEAECVNVRRTLWAVEAPDDLGASPPELPVELLTGGLDTYEACQAEARRLRALGSPAVKAQSAALISGGARGWRVDQGLQPGEERDGAVVVLFGPQPALTGWVAAFEGRPHGELLRRIRHL